MDRHIVAKKVAHINTAGTVALKGSVEPFRPEKVSKKKRIINVPALQEVPPWVTAADKFLISVELSSLRHHPPLIAHIAHNPLNLQSSSSRSSYPGGVDELFSDCPGDPSIYPYVEDGSKEIQELDYGGSDNEM